jgi:periplasmic protein TonB
VASRTLLFALSLGAHAVLGVTLAAIPARVRHEVIGISMTETPKPKPARTVDPPPPPPEPPVPAARPTRARSAPPPAPTAASPDPSPPPSQGDAVPDFGLALSNATGPGLSVPAPRTVEPTPSAAVARILTRAAHAPSADDCDEPPSKPRALSRPVPAYTADARAAGISGKVRVEITVDARGRVTSVHVLQGLGHGLDEAALAAARAMTFEPALRCGKPTSSTFKVGFSFSPGTP